MGISMGRSDHRLRGHSIFATVLRIGHSTRRSLRSWPARLASPKGNKFVGREIREEASALRSPMSDLGPNYFDMGLIRSLPPTPIQYLAQRATLTFLGWTPRLDLQGGLQRLVTHHTRRPKNDRAIGHPTPDVSLRILPWKLGERHPSPIIGFYQHLDGHMHHDG